MPGKSIVRTADRYSVAFGCSTPCSPSACSSAFLVSGVPASVTSDSPSGVPIRRVVVK
jgi:hypothetical protein